MDAYSTLELDDDQYPTGDTLVDIEYWPAEQMEELFRQLRATWPSYGKADYAGGTYEFVTGGWSGCEDMIDALRRNKYFIWTLTWVMSKRGGLHQFQIPRRFVALSDDAQNILEEFD